MFLCGEVVPTCTEHLCEVFFYDRAAASYGLLQGSLVGMIMCMLCVRDGTYCRQNLDFIAEAEREGRVAKPVA